MMKKFIGTLTAILLSTVCFPATYYVSNNGNNSNNGLTVATAFLTLQHASNIVAAGDSVIVLPGTYTGFYQTTSGTPSLPIVFSAQTGAIINAPNATTNDGINLEGASYVTVEGFKLYGVPRAGIRAVIDTGAVIRNNIADSCGVWGILTGFSQNILIENNSCTRSVQQHGIYFGNSADNPIIRNNICWGNNDCGIHMNGDISLGGDGIISNALVENNIIHDNGASGGSGINCDGVQNSRIQNNLLYNNHASGISLYQIDGGDASKNNVVVNNTVLQPSNGRWALNITDGSTGNIVFNNIFYSAHVFRGSITIDAASLTGFYSNHNVQTDRMSNDGGNTVITLAQWTTATQADSNSVISTPALLFANAGSNNYHLIATSPAKDLGRSNYYSVASPLIDLDNVTRPQGNFPDAGAYEFPVTTGITDVATKIISWKNIPANNMVSLFDVSGKLLMKNYKSEIESYLKTLNTGLYIFSCTSPDEKYLQSGWLSIAK